VRTWLPQPVSWSALTAEAELVDPASMLSLYRSLLRLRRQTPGLAATGLTWRPSADGVLDFDRGQALRCVVNLSPRPVSLGAATVLVSSFRPDGLPLSPGWTLDNYVSVWSEAFSWMLLANSFAFALGSTVFALLISIAPILILYFALQRSIINGFAGGLKG
jgi:ABC-type glycerol-3-phosphate transport system permease component